MNMYKTAAGFVMVCSTAISAQASLQLVNSLDTGLEVISAPAGFGQFSVLHADEGTTETASFTFALGSGETFNFATGFLNVEGQYSPYIDSTVLTVTGPNGHSINLWSTDSTKVAWATHDEDGYPERDSMFSGWTPGSFTADESGLYKFQLSVSNEGGGAKNDSLSMFACVPEPSTYVAGVLIGALAFGRYQLNRRNKAAK